MKRILQEATAITGITLPYILTNDSMKLISAIPSLIPQFE
jgi:hypothetical protein